MPRPRITTQRATVLSIIERRSARGLKTCAADVTRLVWSGRGHAATYAVVARMIRAGLLRTTRDTARHLLSIAA